MTIDYNNSLPVMHLLGDGVSTEFPVTYSFRIAQDLEVYFGTDKKQLTVDYNVDLVNGNVVFYTAPAVDTSITIIRATVEERVTDFNDQPRFRADDLDNEFDNNLRMIEDARMYNSAAPSFHPQDIGKVSGLLPAVVPKGFLQINEAGDGFIIEPLADSPDFKDAIDRAENAAKEAENSSQEATDTVEKGKEDFNTLTQDFLKNENLTTNASNVNLIANGFFLAPSGIATPPDATPRSYSQGDELFKGIFAKEDLSDVTYIKGLLTATGELFTDVLKQGKQSEATKFISSVAKQDGFPLIGKSSIEDNISSWRVTFTAEGIFSVKLEQAPIASVHSYKPVDVNARWEAYLEYTEGTRVVASDNEQYVCIQTSIGQDPTKDVDNVYWKVVSGGATGKGSNKVFFINDQHVTGDWVIESNQNAGSFGEIRIDDGVSVTIEDGASWTIVGG